MSMSPAERKRLQVQRKRDHARQQTDLTYEMPRQSFGAWLNEDAAAQEYQHLSICYDGMNRYPPDFKQETDPESASGDFVFPASEDGSYSYRGALGRAELEVALLIEAAKTLAGLINAYKRGTIVDRLKQIEADELNNPNTRPVKIKEVVDLNKALELLDKSVRAEIPQWELRG